MERTVGTAIDDDDKNDSSAVHPQSIHQEQEPIPLMTSMISMRRCNRSSSSANTSTTLMDACKKNEYFHHHHHDKTTSTMVMPVIPEEGKQLVEATTATTKASSSSSSSQGISLKVQELLKIAACLDSFDRTLMTAALYPACHDDIEKRYDEAVQLGWIVPMQIEANNDNNHDDDNDNDSQNRQRHGRQSYSSSSFAFLNAEIQEAAYNLIAPSDRSQLHLSLGRSLLRHLHNSNNILESSSANSNQYYTNIVLRQYHEGRAQLLQERTNRSRRKEDCSGPDDENRNNEAHTVAILCHRAAQHAVSESNFHDASVHLDFGISLLSMDDDSYGNDDCSCSSSSGVPWHTDYDLTLSLYNAAAEVEFALANFEKMEHLIAQVLREARSFRDSLLARATQVYALGGRGRTVEAVQEGLCVLRHLGIVFPNRVKKLHVAMEVMKTNKLLRGRTDEMIARIPLMTNTDMIAAMQMLNLIFPSVFKTNPYLAFLVSSRMVTLSLEHGLSAISSVGFSMFGTMYCSFTSNTDAGYRFGQLALSLLDRFQVREWLPRVYFSVYGNINRRRDRLKDLIDPLHQGYCVGMETGDIEFAMLNASLHVAFMLFGGQPLASLEKQALVYIEAMETHKQLSSLMKTRSILQFVQNLMGKTEDPLHVCGDEFDEDVSSARANHLLLTWRYFQKMILRYIFADYEGAEREAVAFRSLRKYLHFKSSFGFISLVEGLALLAVCNERPRNVRRKHLSVVRGNIKQLKKEALLNPRDVVGKQFLLEAELAAVTGKHDIAQQKYICAIAVANDNDDTLDHAIACERYGRYLIGIGNNESLIDYLLQASTSYGKWGAQCKVEQLETELEGTSCETCDT